MVRSPQDQHSFTDSHPQSDKSHLILRKVRCTLLPTQEKDWDYFLCKLDAPTFARNHLVCLQIFHKQDIAMSITKVSACTYNVKTSNL